MCLQHDYFMKALYVINSCLSRLFMHECPFNALNLLRKRDLCMFSHAVYVMGFITIVLVTYNILCAHLVTVSCMIICSMHGMFSTRVIICASMVCHWLLHAWNIFLISDVYSACVLHVNALHVYDSCLVSVRLCINSLYVVCVFISIRLTMHICSMPYISLYLMRACNHASYLCVFMFYASCLTYLCPLWFICFQCCPKCLCLTCIHTDNPCLMCSRVCDSCLILCFVPCMYSSLMCIPIYVAKQLMSLSHVCL